MNTVQCMAGWGLGFFLSWLQIWANTQFRTVVGIKYHRFMFQMRQIIQTFFNFSIFVRKVWWLRGVWLCARLYNADSGFVLYTTAWSPLFLRENETICKAVDPDPDPHGSGSRREKMSNKNRKNANKLVISASLFNLKKKVILHQLYCCFLLSNLMFLQLIRLFFTKFY